MSNRPQRLYRGCVEARGLWLDRQFLGDETARQRALDAWQVDARLYEFLGGYVLLYATTQWIDTCRAPGVVLCELDNVLTNCPLSAEELRRPGEQANDVLLLQRGVLHGARLDDSVRIEPSDWISLEEMDVETVEMILKPPATIPPLSVPRAREARRLFGNKIPRESPEAQSLREMLQGLAPRKPEKGQAGSFLHEGMGLLAAAFRRRFRRLRGRAVEGRSSDDEQSRSLSLFSRFMLMTRLSRVVGWRQAGYIRRMLDIFESGDLEAALRHAIPLGRGNQAQDLSWSVMRPRSELQITGGSASGSSLFFGDELYEHLRRLYRQSFERLDQHGRTHEAAFVLAELLQANEEAVRYLEKHGELRAAAELAEERNLSPGLVVRQWLKAGDGKRAFAVARRTGAFNEGVVILEHHGEREQANKLRLVWASTLAEAGDYAGAVEAIWPVQEARRLASDWLQRAMTTGTPSAARLLARRLELMPGRFDETRSAVERLLTDEGREAAALREAFALQLLAQKGSRAAAVLARPTYRALLQDRCRHENRWTRRQLERLIKLSNDAALRADSVPILTSQERMPLNRSENVHGHAVRGSGLLPVRDARILPRDRILVAMGEAGIRLLNPEGKTLRHFDVPAEFLVLSDSGNRALALMPRRGFASIARIDLDAATARVWHETPLWRFLPTYDGSSWFVAIEDRLLAIDTLGQRFEALWSTPMPGKIRVMQRDPQSLHLALSIDDEREVWRYELPSLTLRERRPFPQHSSVLSPCFGIRPGPGRSRRPGTICGLKLKDDRDLPRLVLWERFAGEMASERVLDDRDVKGLSLVLTPDWTVLSLLHSNRVEVQLIDAAHQRTRATIHLEDAQTVSAHVDRDLVVLSDGNGRITSLDLRTGDLVHRIQM